MNEIWKPIPNYEGRYEVSNMGRVKSIKRNRIWNGYVARNGYMKIALYKDNIQKSRFVHDIVAETFIENPLGYTEIDHIDRNPANNSIDNLRWVSHKENTRNMKSNNNITIDGETKTLAEWSEISGIPYHTLKKRIYNGWDLRTAISDPLDHTRRRVNTDYNRVPNSTNARFISYNGETHTIPEWSKIVGIKTSTLRSRLNMGWSVEELFVPLKRVNSLSFKKMEGEFE